MKKIKKLKINYFLLALLFFPSSILASQKKEFLLKIEMKSGKKRYLEITKSQMNTIKSKTLLYEEDLLFLNTNSTEENVLNLNQQNKTISYLSNVTSGLGNLTNLLSDFYTGNYTLEKENLIDSIKSYAIEKIHSTVPIPYKNKQIERQTLQKLIAQIKESTNEISPHRCSLISTCKLLSPYIPDPSPSYQGRKIKIAILDDEIVPGSLNTNTENIQYPLSEKLLWVNTLEKNGTEGVDDDGNGYIDDIYGWDATTEKPLKERVRTDDAAFHGKLVSYALLDELNKINQLLPEDERVVVEIIPITTIRSHSIDNFDTHSPARDILSALEYASSLDVDIINMSIALIGYYKFLHEKLNEIYQNSGIAIFLSAGNFSLDVDKFPVFSPRLYPIPSSVPIGALDSTEEQIASYSSYGDRVTAFLSGTLNLVIEIATHRITGVSTRTIDIPFLGTSFSSPRGAAYAAIAKNKAPQLTGYQIKNLVQSIGTRQGASFFIKSEDSYRNAFLATLRANENTPSYQPDYTPEYKETSIIEVKTINKSNEFGGCGTISSKNRPPANPWNLFLLLTLFSFPLVSYFYLSYLATFNQSKLS